MPKKDRYKLLLKQAKSLMQGETDIIATLANLSALLKDTFHFWWVGFYLVKEEQLVLGPFQGPVACSRISFGKGVCGTAWKEKHTIIVPNIKQFPGHIACSSKSRSEIVIPIIRNDDVIGVLDIDSEQLNNFDKTDADELEFLITLLQI